MKVFLLVKTLKLVNYSGISPEFFCRWLGEGNEARRKKKREREGGALAAAQDV